MDVTILRKCLTAFRHMFNELKTPMGRAIGVDPFLYLIITAVTFDGIYRQLSSRKTSEVLLHAPNSSKIGTEEVHVPVASHTCYKFNSYVV